MRVSVAGSWRLSALGTVRDTRKGELVCGPVCSCLCMRLSPGDKSLPFLSLWPAVCFVCVCAGGDIPEPATDSVVVTIVNRRGGRSLPSAASVAGALGGLPGVSIRVVYFEVGPLGTASLPSLPGVVAVALPPLVSCFLFLG